MRRGESVFVAIPRGLFAAIKLGSWSQNGFVDWLAYPPTLLVGPNNAVIPETVNFGQFDSLQNLDSTFE